MNQMEKKKFRIGELAKTLKVKKFVIRFWEKEFDLQADRSQGGQRYYTQDDFEAFNTIKSLLYQQGYTIAGAKMQLGKTLQTTAATQTEFQEEREIQAATKTTETSEETHIPQELLSQLKTLKQQLLALKKAIE